MNLKELADEPSARTEEKKETQSTWASTQGSPETSKFSVISDTFIQHYAEVKPKCYLKSKTKQFEKHQIELSANEIRFIPCGDSATGDRSFKISGAHIKQSLSERCPNSNALLYSMKLALA